ncbi:hypothetical protein ROTAS13_02759 [Roseomonas sp. TAS13]|jgi:hypothetical protein|uniref:Uncharacterized protein n=1 Tax=Roseomonas mucosa TaxID=207340 RepID=A0A379PMS0_9PROT|nr:MULTISPECIES: hypothetical protein [Roseomonas]MBS5904501.1 hypothetical protein [Acetobacteraceae bacterium]QDD97396.1 hypothetical protein ADP8_05118 [Roseomonas mucosa]QET91382.1 hypothetical protein FOB66_00035 [Roseomonas mucosa]USQ74452.1 hypothetical protein NF552_24335 [Roseomonas mucosa]SUE95653.1 Uncharacterised protein [Roseomonas mucosa]
MEMDQRTEKLWKACEEQVALLEEALYSANPRDYDDACEKLDEMLFDLEEMSTAVRAHFATLHQQ